MPPMFGTWRAFRCTSITAAVWFDSLLHCWISIISWLFFVQNSSKTVEFRFSSKMLNSIVILFVFIQNEFLVSAFNLKQCSHIMNSQCEQSADQTTSAACSSTGLNSSSVVYEMAWPETITRDRPATDNKLCCVGLERYQTRHPISSIQ